jgi:membrane protein required for colicin V production
MHWFSLLDILLWGILAATAVKGFMKGLVREVCALIGVVAGAWAAFNYYGSVAAVLVKFIKLPHAVAVSLSFLLIYLVLGLLFFLVGHLLTVIFKIMLLGWLNRLGGIVFGLLQGAFILCMLLAMGTSGPVPPKVKGYLQSSSMSRTLAQAGRDMIADWKGTRRSAAKNERH